MLSILSSIILMAPPADGQGGSGSLIGMFLPFVAIIAIMYFLMIRPQQKRAKEHQKMLSDLRRGDKIITGSGIHGSITDVEDKTFVIQIADNVKIKVEKSAVTSKI